MFHNFIAALEALILRLNEKVAEPLKEQFQVHQLQLSGLKISLDREEESWQRSCERFFVL
jgi:hypothetical protein